MEQVQFPSEHFTLHRIQTGVFAATAIPGGGAYSNAGIIDIGGHTLIFDAFDTPAAALDLLQAVKDYAFNDQISVLLSHHHFDHRGGLQVFPPSTPIISTYITRQLILESENDPDYSIEGELEEMQEYREELLHQLETQADERWLTNLKASISHLDHFIKAIPTFNAQIPDQTFEKKIRFYGSEMTAELVHAGSGHTLSDSYLLLSGDRVAFIGDIGFFQCHPYLLDSDPDGWRSILHRLLKLDVDTIIPGHGPKGSKEDLSLLIDYLDILELNAQQFLNVGRSKQDASELDIPAPFHRWSYGINRFAPNMRFFYERAAAAQLENSG
jgi:cyclase